MQAIKLAYDHLLYMLSLVTSVALRTVPMPCALHEDVGLKEKVPPRPQTASTDMIEIDPQGRLRLRVSPECAIPGSLCYLFVKCDFVCTGAWKTLLCSKIQDQAPNCQQHNLNYCSITKHVARLAQAWLGIRLGGSQLVMALFKSACHSAMPLQLGSSLATRGSDAP